eukprot:9140400-Pyramimonas_sp.AAC.1
MFFNFRNLLWIQSRGTVRSLKRVGCEVTRMKRECVKWWILNGIQQEPDLNPSGILPTGILLAP